MQKTQNLGFFACLYNLKIIRAALHTGPPTTFYVEKKSDWFVQLNPVFLSVRTGVQQLITTKREFGHEASPFLTDWIHYILPEICSLFFGLLH